VHGAGPGTLLGGRYALRRRLSQAPDLERWSAHDTTLEREVALTIIDSDHPRRAGVLDAARRAAGVEDARLIRILDVGTQDGNSFIVEEATAGSRSMDEILSRGPLPAEEARRIAGETARGLTAAGQRGLHHLRLTPHCVMITPDGAVRVSGLAVAAAIDGPDEQEPDPALASRLDAVCIVALAYAALTGRWPLAGQVLGVEPAPRVLDGVAAPSEIVSGVPDDLDLLCRLTFNDGAGPATPAEVASQIAPWSRERVQSDGVEPTVALPLPAKSDVGDVGEVSDASEDTDRIPVSAVATETVGDKAAAAGAAATQAVGTALANAGTAAGVVGGKLGSLARSAAEKTQAFAGLGTEPIGLPGQFDEIEPPLPMLPASTAQPPTRGQTKIVVLVVVTFVTLMLLVGYCGLRGLGGGGLLTGSTPKGKAAVTASPAATPTQPGAAAAGNPIAILSATGFDPDGDRNEKNDQAARVYDNNPATMWTSERYNSAQFGGLKKGVGLLLDLGQPTSVHQVTIDLGSGPVDVTVYAAPDASLAGATVIGTASAATGRIQLTAATTMPRAQNVIVWFTKLAPDGGQFRASIKEIALT